LHCLVVEDERILLDLLASAIESFSEITTVSKAQTAKAAEEISSLSSIDLAVLDLKLPDGHGCDLAKSLLKRYADIQLIVLSGAAQEFDCPPELRPAVKAVIDKAHAFHSLHECLKQALRPGTQQLTKRQREIFSLIGQGKTNKEIARLAGSSISTIETHRKMIAKKLNLSGAELIREATLYQQRESIQ